MRKIFSGYYTPTEEQFNKLWKECTFVFDTNTLINLYRYPQKTRDLLFLILEKIKDRLWIPHQIALEYHRNFLNEIYRQEDEYQKLNNEVTKTAEDLIKKFKDLRHSNIKVEDIISLIDRMTQEVKDELEKQKQNHPNLELFKDKIADLFGDNMGTAYSQKQLDDIYIEGAERYKSATPPGFKDEAKKKEEFYYDGGIKYIAKYGDLIFWNQILDKSKEEKLDSIILVSDDAKEDWVYQVNGKKKGVHPQLVQEFKMESGRDKSFYMYTTESFLEFSEKYLMGIENTSQISSEDIAVAMKDIAEVKKEKEKEKEYSNFTIAWPTLKEGAFRYRVILKINDNKSYRIKDSFEEDLNEIYEDEIKIVNTSVNHDEMRVTVRTNIRINTGEFLNNFMLLHEMKELNLYSVQSISVW
ncbi:PIN-like domain-containing protein [Paenibacillus sp. FSL R10-2778]|uniref:PIN-like domain-containing protein n=1 Tax=Paenibacillus sp. FSL R10-2778 TaxID=2954659 RepID=UPI00315910CF